MNRTDNHFPNHRIPAHVNRILDTVCTFAVGSLQNTDGRAMTLNRTMKSLESTSRRLLDNITWAQVFRLENICNEESRFLYRLTTYRLCDQCNRSTEDTLDQQCDHAHASFNDESKEMHKTTVTYIQKTLPKPPSYFFFEPAICNLHFALKDPLFHTSFHQAR